MADGAGWIPQMEQNFRWIGGKSEGTPIKSQAHAQGKNNRVLEGGWSRDTTPRDEKKQALEGERKKKQLLGRLA